MTLSELLARLHTRAGNLPRTDSVDHALATLTGLGCMPGPESTVLRRVLMVLAHSHTAPQFDLEELVVIGPLAAGALICLIEALMDRRYNAQAVRDALS